MWVTCCLVVALCFEDCLVGCEEFSNKRFPEYFKFGVATSAYQVEGAWNEDGKSESIWDRLLHVHPNFTTDHSNGNVACDFYHKYKDDILILKDLGVDFFRLSISWPRILPYGTNDYVNWKGVAHYRAVITELLKNEIEPMVTIYHWDMPQILQDRGGLLNEEFVQWFADFSAILFREFGDLVKIWTTFNEPRILCSFGYGLAEFAPALNGDGVFDYICGHNLLKAHAKAYHIYDEQFRAYQKGEIGMVVESTWYEPGSSRPEDIEAAETAIQFNLGWFVHPIYTGDYPEVMKYNIARRSHAEGRNKSRLPEFTPEEIATIRGTNDYFGLNHYTTELVFHMEPTAVEEGPGYSKDMEVNRTTSPDWPDTCVSVFKVAPFGMRKLLAFIKERYSGPPIYITENGRCDFGTIEDDDRVFFIKAYLSNVLDAMEKDYVDVRRYTYWSFMDCFEWGSGYLPKFGTYHVDFSNPELPRTPKKSTYVYNKIIKSHCLLDQCEQLNISLGC